MVSHQRRKVWITLYTSRYYTKKLLVRHLIRIEAARSGRFNPVFKEAPHANQGILEGMASRQGVYRASQTMRRHRHVGVIGGTRKRFGVSVVSGEPVISGPLRSDGRMRTHGCRGR